jgi:hypothetical protein
LVACFSIAVLDFFAKAHTTSGYENGKAKPNSLLYILNGDTGKAYWASYDKTTDEWTKGYLGENLKMLHRSIKSTLQQIWFAIYSDG